MRKIWDFHGGIHPPENKLQSTAAPIRAAGIPARLVLPLQQHMGAPAKPIVAVGEKVLKGQKIAEANGFVSLPVHAPTSGTIAAIEDHGIAHPSGMTDLCILLDSDGQDQWINHEGLADYRSVEPAQLLQRIRDAGIAGMGGAGFPTVVKLHPPKRNHIRTLILNAAECEPYITADDMLMRERAAEVIGGMEIMAHLLEPEECLIGIEDNKPQAIQALRAAAQGTQIEILVVPTKYPSGGEKQLIKLLTGNEVPSGGIPADIGVVCQNVGTAVAVYRAIHLGEPLLSRITTITGSAIGKPQNLEALLGTPIEFLLQACGHEPSRTSRLIMGGPMMGFTLTDTQLPVVKTTNCIMAVTAQEFPPQPPELACIRCGMCAEACPAELLPQQLFWFSRSGEFDKAEQFNLFDCIECGACSYVCPSSIPLVQYYRFAKGEVRRQKLEQEKSNRARERFEFRKLRQEREEAEKEARRKARAEAAAANQAAKQAAASAPAASKSDDKSAAVQAALARVAAKRQSAAPAAPAVDITELEQNVERAQDKLEKMRAMLADAQQHNPEQVDKLGNAVRKNEERLRSAQQELEQARASVAKAPAAAPAGSGNVDISQLERALARAQNKVDTLRQAIADAQTQDQERAEKLQGSLAAAEAKLTEAQQQFAAASAPAAQAPALDDSNSPSLEELTEQVAKAEDKLAKMEAALADAQASAPENVEKLTRAVDKNRARLQAAQDALQQAQAAAVPAPMTEPAAVASDSGASLDELTEQVAKAEDKLAKMEAALADAQASAPENVEKLTRAVDNNRARLQAAKDALQQAQAAAGPATTQANGATFGAIQE